VHLIGGKKKTNITLFDWAQQVQDLGAGEILFTSMDHDGTKKGFAIDALKELKSKVKIPIIASGGGGSINHFFNVFNEADVDGALAASIFHYNEIQIPSLKKELKQKGVEIRI
jgi:cyclase